MRSTVCPGREFSHKLDAQLNSISSAPSAVERSEYSCGAIQQYLAPGTWHVRPRTRVYQNQEITAVAQPLLQAYRPARGRRAVRSCALCYTRVAMHGINFPSARVIVVVLPLPSVLDVFPSVQPTTIVKVCIQFAGFEQN